MTTFGSFNSISQNSNFPIITIILQIEGSVHVLIKTIWWYYNLFRKITIIMVNIKVLFCKVIFLCVPLACNIQGQTNLYIWQPFVQNLHVCRFYSQTELFTCRACRYAVLDICKLIKCNAQVWPQSQRLSLCNALI